MFWKPGLAYIAGAEQFHFLLLRSIHTQKCEHLKYERQRIQM